MHSQLYAQMIRIQQEEIAARTIHRHDVHDIAGGATPRSRRMRRRAAKAIAALGVWASSPPPARPA